MLDDVQAGHAHDARSVCVCVPARNEAQRIGLLLDALARQDLVGALPVAICLNNTTDGSRAVIDEAGARWHDRLRLFVDDVTFAPAVAHAGSARRHAMAMGAAALAQRPDAVLISTDADSRPPAQWVRNTLEAFEQGADLVGGRLEIDCGEPLTEPMASVRMRLDGYWAKVRAIEDAIDPQVWDPAPRHGDHTGASLALRISLHNAVGGVPLEPRGEDRALVARAVAMGAHLRHPPDVWTRVSGRLNGRAQGGMADDLARLAQLIGQGRPLLVPSFDQWRSRAEWRREWRQVSPGIGNLPDAEANLPPMLDDMPLPALGTIA